MIFGMGRKTTVVTHSTSSSNNEDQKIQQTGDGFAVSGDNNTFTGIQSDDVLKLFESSQAGAAEILKQALPKENEDLKKELADKQEKLIRQVSYGMFGLMALLILTFSKD